MSEPVADTHGLRPTATGAACFAYVTVIVAALSVQRACMGDRPELVPWLWGAVGAAALMVWRWTDRVAPSLPAPPPLAARAASRHRRHASEVLLVGAAFTLCVGLVLLFRNLLSSPGTWLWAVGLLGIAVAVAVCEAQPPRLGQRLRAGSDRRWWWLAVVPVATAFALRLYRLDTIPATLLQDEAVVADWGLNYLHHAPVWGQHVATAIPLFRNGATAYPLLGSVLHAVVMQVAGETTFGLRLTAALCGGMTVWIFYLIASTYLSRRAAIAATALLAVSHVHLHWTRLGMLQSMTTLAATLIVWFMLRGLRAPGYLSFVLAGLCLGIAQYLYEGARFLAVIVVLFVVYLAVTDRQFLRRRAAHIAVMAVMAVAVVAPIGFWYHTNPSALLGRSREVLLFAQPVYRESVYPGLNAAHVALAQLRRSLMGFAYFGDGSAAFDELSVPLFDPITGALILAGLLGFSLQPRRPVDALVALWIWVPIAISCTVTIDPPPMTRLIMIFPAFFFVAGVALERLGQLFEQTAQRFHIPNPTTPLVALGVGCAAMWTCSKFFIVYPRVGTANVWTEAGRLARAAGPTSKTYMVSPMSLYFYAPEMRFLARGLAGADVPAEDIPVREQGYRDGLFLISPQLPDTLQKVRAAYPSGQLEEHRDHHGRLLFTAYRVDAATLNAAAGADAPWQQYDLRFGMGGKRTGEFENASGLAVDREGRTYVADTGNGQIDVFEADGSPAGVLGRSDDGEAAFRQLCAVAVAPDTSVLGLDCDTRHIKRFSRTGEWLGDLGVEAELTRPAALAVAPDGSVVVADSGQQAILRFDATGALLTRAGAGGDGPGQFVRPDAVAVDTGGTVYVADGASGRVQQFTAQLEYQGQWRIPQNQGTTAIAVADGSVVYVADPQLARVQRYTPDGRAQWTVGAVANDPFKLLRPVAVATDRAGNVYVLDGARNQVLRYDVTRRRG